MPTPDPRSEQPSRSLARAQGTVSRGRDDRQCPIGASMPLSQAVSAAKPPWAWLLWLHLLVVLLATLSAYLGLLELPVLSVPGIDKALHLVLCGGLAFFSVAWWADRRPHAVLGILSLLAVLEEISQTLSALRTFSPIDLVANLTGILVFGSAAGWLVHKRRHTLSSRRSA